jgi:hypothetical protein
VPDPPPTLISAVHTGAPFAITLTFDQVIAANPGAPGSDWLARHDNIGQGSPTVSVPGTDQVVLSTWTALGPDAGIDVVSYTNNVDALQSLSGVPVASFSDFPVT